MNLIFFKYAALGFTILSTLGGCTLILWRSIRTFFRTVVQSLINRHEPIVALPARVISKRTEPTGNRATEFSGTIYYVTLQTEDSLKQEVWLPAGEFNQLSVGDIGTLTRQGSAYKSFQPQPTS